MEEILSNERLKISPRALALAIQNNVNILEVSPTGPDGRIIENDILRAIEKRNAPKEEAPAPAEPIEEAPAEEAPVEEVPVEEPSIEEIPVASEAEEPIAEESAVAEEAAETAETVEDTAPVVETAEETTEAVEEVIEPADVAADTIEEVAEIAETVEDTAEEATESAEEVIEEATETVEEAEKTEESAEEPTEDAPVEDIVEEKKEETAIMAVPVTSVATEETKEEPKIKEESAEKTFKAEEMYRHTDVIIAQDEKAPDATPITLEMSFDATAVVGLREKIKENGELMNLPSITLNDMILFATAKTLKKHKALNAHFLGDKIRYFDGIHLGIAVDTERGPQTLTVFDTDRLSLSSLSKITGALVRGARAGNSSPEKNQRMGSFTVTNVGTLGVERFIPTLTAPQTGVLGVCALTRRLKLVNGEEVSYPCIPLSLTFDPRAISTANAAKFLRDLCTALENFGLLLIK